MSIPNWVPFESRSAYSACGNAARAERRIVTGVDAETQRRRFLEDRRGKTIREGRDYSASEEKHWLIRYSIFGDIDQVDLLRNGELFAVGGLERAERAILRGVWRSPARMKQNGRQVSALPDEK